MKAGTSRLGVRVTRLRFQTAWLVRLAMAWGKGQEGRNTIRLPCRGLLLAAGWAAGLRGLETQGIDCDDVRAP